MSAGPEPERTSASTQGRPLARLWPFLVLLSAVAALVWLALGPQRPAGRAKAAVGPRLQVDETSYDFGVVAYEQVVQHEFVLRNVGDQPLELQRLPKLVTVEGC